MPNGTSDIPTAVALSVAVVTFEGSVMAAITASLTGAMKTSKCNVAACKSIVAEISGRM